MKELKLVRVEPYNDTLEVSTFLVGANVELQVLHTKGSKEAQSWDYPIKPNGLSTKGAQAVLSSFDFSKVDNSNESD